jgi:hypothetical protein
MQKKMNITEEWKVIKDFNNEYYISNLGRIKSVKFGKEKFLKIDYASKYAKIHLFKNNKRTKFTIHRLVAIYFVKNLEDKPCVNHIDGNKFNNIYLNLEWCTNQENSIHAWENGLNENLRKSSSKKVLDIYTNIKYDSLVYACKIINESYNIHRHRIIRNSANKRFIFI